jgi:uncharacterized coiled-coil protein SlyX
MLSFELSAKKRKNGRRPFKAVLHEVYPDGVVENNVGTQFNENGICWVEQYCKDNIESIKGMSITAQFVNNEETELLGHGEYEIEDGIPVFKDATIIGNAERGYLDTVEINGEQKRVLVAEGTIDQMRHNEFVKWLEGEITNGKPPKGSVEIVRSEQNEKIVYLNGKFEQGRIPVAFDYSGYALLGVRPADQSAVLLEFNNNKESEEKEQMDELKNLLVELSAKIDKTAEQEKVIEQNASALAELNASVDQLKAALGSVEAEKNALNVKYEELYAEAEGLRLLIAAEKAKARVGEMNAALADFTDEQKAVAKDEIAAFEADPMSVEINSIVEKILVHIGKRALEDGKVAEQNAEQEKAKGDTLDIFEPVYETNDKQEEVSIF